MTHHTYSSQIGSRVPYSHWLLRHLKEALQIGEAGTDKTSSDGDGVSTSTINNYLATGYGEAGKAEEVVAVLINQALPSVFHPRFSDEIEGDAREQFSFAAKCLLSFWDEIVSEVNENTFEAANQKYLALAILRLVSFDFGIRLGAWANLRTTRGKPVDLNKTWLALDVFQNMMKRRRKELGLTQEDLAERVQVERRNKSDSGGTSTTTIRSWESGRTTPSRVNLKELAKVLRREDETVQEASNKFQRAVAISYAHGQLMSLIGRKELLSHLGAVKQIAKVSMEEHERFTSRVSSEGSEGLHEENLKNLRHHLWWTLLFGVQSPRGIQMVSILAHRAQRNYAVHFDFRSLLGNWAGRIGYWLRHYSERRLIGGSASLPLVMGKLSRTERKLLYAQYDKQAKLENLFRVEDRRECVMDNYSEALWLYELGEQYWSVGAYEEALGAYEKATHLEPSSAGLRFKYGSALGHCGRESRNEALQVSAILELEKIVREDAEFGNAQNEIGVILSNMRDHHRAEEAFSRVTGAFTAHHQHWICRGKNFLAMNDFAPAEGALEKAIECIDVQMGSGLNTFRREGVEAKAYLAIAKKALGKEREAKELANDVQKKVGVNILNHWQKRVNPWESHIFGDY